MYDMYTVCNHEYKNQPRKAVGITTGPVPADNVAVVEFKLKDRLVAQAIRQSFFPFPILDKAVIN